MPAACAYTPETCDVKVTGGSGTSAYTDIEDCSHAAAHVTGGYAAYRAALTLSGLTP